MKDLKQESQKLLNDMREIVVSGWSNENNFIICYSKFHINNGCSVLGRSEKSILKEIFKDEWEPIKWTPLSRPFLLIIKEK